MNNSTIHVLGGGRWANRGFEYWVVQALRLSPVLIPNLLIIPTPLELDDLPCDELSETIKRFMTPHVRRTKVQSLTHDTQAPPDYECAKKLIDWADVILILGGLFPEQMKRFKATGIDRLLLDAAHAGGKVFVGSSTGMLVWFKAGQTVERPLPENPATKYEPATNYHVVEGMNYFPALASAHMSEFGSAQNVARAHAVELMMSLQPVGTVCIGAHTSGVLVVKNDLVTIGAEEPYIGIQRIEVTSSGLKRTIHKPGQSPIPVEQFFGPTV